MSPSSERLDILRRSTPREAARIVYRKAIHRKVELCRYEERIGDSSPPGRPLELRLELLGPNRFDPILETNPHKEASDHEHFHRQETVCIAVWDGDRLASSSWMTKGDVYIHELQRTIHVPPNEHLSCRTYVDPDYRGLSLMSHMLHGYSTHQPPDDIVWGFAFSWNMQSIASIERIGWRHTGDYWTRWVLVRPLPGERHFAPRPPTTLS